MTSPCPYCGADNPETCLNCRSCGRHLPPRTLAEPGSRLSLVTGIRLLLFLAALSVLILILLLPPVSGEVNDSAQVDVFYRNLVSMEHAVRQQKEYSWTASEGDVNAYLEAVVEKHETQSPNGWRRLILARADFQEGVAELALHYKWGPVTLAQMLTLLPPGHENQKERWRIQSFSLGKLPVPRVLHARAASILLQSFEAFERDLFVLRHVSEIHLDETKAYLVNRKNGL